MADINLTGDATSLVRALEQASAAFVDFNSATARVVKDQARLNAQSQIITRTLRVVDAAGTQLVGTFKAVDTSIKTLAATTNTANAALETTAAALRAEAVAAQLAADAALQTVASARNVGAARAANIRAIRLQAEADALGARAIQAFTAAQAAAIPVIQNLATATLSNVVATRALVAESSKSVGGINQQVARLNSLRAASESVTAGNERRLVSERQLTVQAARTAAGPQGAVAAGAVRLNQIRAENAQLIEQQGLLARIANLVGIEVGADAADVAFIRAQTNALIAQLPIRERIALLTGIIPPLPPPGSIGSTGFTGNIENADKAAQGLGSSLSGLGRLIGISLLIGAAFRLVTALSDGARAAIEFEQAVAEIRTIDTARIATETWVVALRDLSDSFGISVVDQAEAAYQALSNQIANGATVQGFLTAANQLATAAVTDVSAATNLLTAALNAFSIDASRAEEVSAQFFKTVELGRVRVDEMAESFGRIAVPASQLGVTFPELNAAIATTTINGIKFNEASTLVRNILLKLIRPTDAMKELFQEIGVESGQAAIQTFGLQGFLEILEETTRGSATELGELFGRIRAITGALVFAGDGVERFNRNLEQIRDISALEDFRRATELVLRNTGRELEIEFNKIRNFFEVELGRSLLEVLADVNESIGGFTNALRNLTRFIDIAFEPALALITLRLTAMAIASIRAAQANGTLLASFTRFNVALLAITAIAAAVTLLTNETETAAEASQRLSVELTQSLSARAEAENKAISDSLEATKDIIRERTRLFNQPIATNIIRPLNEEFKEIEETFKNLEKATEESIKNIISEVRKLVTESNKVFDDFDDRAQESAETIDDLFEDRDLQIFRLELEGTDDVGRQLQIFTARIEELERSRATAIRSGELEDFNKISKELTNLQIQRGDLQRSIQGTLSLEDQRILKIQQIRDLVKEEATLRRRLAEDDRIRAEAVRKIVLQQELAIKDLESAFEAFKARDFQEALSGGDENEIRRTLIERERSAARIVALQRELGVVREDEGDIAAQIESDRLAAVNRIQSVRAQALIDERNESQKILLARAQAFDRERKIREETLSAEIRQVDTLRQLIEQESRERLPSLLGGGVVPESVAGIGLRDSTALTVAFGEAGAAQAEALIPVIERLLRAQQLDPDDISAASVLAIERDRQNVIAGIERVLGARGTQEEIRARRDEQRRLIQAITEIRAGDDPSGRSAATALFGTLGLQDLEEGFQKTDATVVTFEQVLSNLTRTTGSFFQRQAELSAATQRVLELQQRIQKLNEIEISQKEDDITKTDRLQKLEDELAEAIQSDIDLRQQDAAILAGAPDRIADANLTPSINDALVNTQSTWNQVFQTAAASTGQQQIDNAVAAEERKQEITSQSIREELEARGRAAAEQAKQQERIARLGPGAAERAALTAGTTGSARRKAIAEARAADRAATIAEANRIQDERIAAAEAAREEEAQSRGQQTATDDEALAVLRRETTNLLRGEAEARRDLAEQLEVTAVAPDEEITPGGIIDPLGTETGELSTSLDGLETATDLLNETMTVLANELIKQRGGELTSVQFRRDETLVTGGGDPLLINQEVATAQEEVGARAAELAESFARLEAAERLAAEERQRRLNANIAEFGEATARFAQFLDDTVRQGQALFNPAAAFAHGGQVPGVGNRDTVPALLTPGEFVVRKQMAQRFMPQLLAFNSGKLQPQRFNHGGPVTLNSRVTVNESSSPQATAKAVVAEINRGIRQGTIRIQK